MKHLISADKKRLLGYYILSVLAVAAILILTRWHGAEGFWARMDLISLSIWQAVVWPLYLLMLLTGKN